MTGISPRHLTHQKAWEILFPGHGGSPEAAAGLPPALTWEPWTPPTPAMPVDQAITNLIKSGRIGPRTEAERDGIFCPFYITRMRLGYAAEESAKAIEKVKARQSIIGPNIETICKKIDGTQEKLSSLNLHKKDSIEILLSGTSSLGEMDDLDGIAHDNKLMQKTFDNISILEKQLSELKQRLEARARRIVPQNTPGDRWKIAWAFNLDLLCRLLTGKPICKNSGLSYEFLILAYSSIGGEYTSASDWSSPVKRADEKFKKLPEQEKSARIQGNHTIGLDLNKINKVACELAADQLIARSFVLKALEGKDENACRAATAIFCWSSAKIQIYMEALGWTADMRERYPMPAREA